MKSCFNWTSSRQTRDERRAPNKLIWSSVIKSSAPVLMNRVPVAFPQSHTESSSSSILPIFHIFPCHISFSFVTSFIFIAVTFLSLSDSLALYLSFYLHLLLLLPIVSYYPSLSLLSSVTRSAVFRKLSRWCTLYSLWKEPHMLHRLKLWRKAETLRNTNKMKWTGGHRVLWYICRTPQSHCCEIYCNYEIHNTYRRRLNILFLCKNALIKSSANQK